MLQPDSEGLQQHQSLFQNLKEITGAHWDGVRTLSIILLLPFFYYFYAFFFLNNIKVLKKTSGTKRSANSSDSKTTTTTTSKKAKASQSGDGDGNGEDNFDASALLQGANEDTVRIYLFSFINILLI